MILKRREQSAGLTVKHWRWLSFILPPLVLAAALGLSWFEREQVRREIEDSLQADFDARISEIVGIFRERVLDYEQMLHATNSLFEASVNVAPDEFKAFTNGLHIGHYPGLQGIGYVRTLPSSNSGHSSEAHYFEPPDHRLNLPGADYFAEPSRHPAMAAARDSGLTTISSKKKLPEEDAANIQGGFRMYHAVYRNGYPRNTVAERRANLAGWVYVAFNVDELMAHIAVKQSDLAIDIYDGSNILDGAQTFDSRTDRVGGESALKLLYGSQVIEVGNYSWVLDAHALPNFASPMAIANLRLITQTGIAASLILAFFTWLILRRKMFALQVKQQLDAARHQQILAQERLQAILDNSPNGIWMMDMDGRYHFVNKTFCNAVGIAESKFLAAQHISDIMAPEDAANCLKSDRECLEQDAPHLSHETLTFVDGKRHQMEITKVKLRDDSGAVSGLIGTAIDVTEHRKREAELAASRDRLRDIEHRQALSQERQRLMQDMHDGMGSSLANALMVVERGRMDEAEVAQILMGCIDDLKLAIDSMEPVEADLLLLLATLRYRLGPRLESTGIALRWEVKSVPKLDWLDPKNSLHILRILQEAFTNIIRHSHATEVRVATRAEGDHVVVTVTDNGQGFAVENALESGGKGLSNQIRRAEAIGAEVNWNSSDTGTCFTLRLPIKRQTSGD